MSDNVSSSVVFHITRSMKNLTGILKDGFIPHCCPEYGFGDFDEVALKKQQPPFRAVAMVCFCDLPLSLIRKHLGTYGQFGIGLRKEWGIQHGLEPVIYSHPNAQTRAPISRLTALIWEGNNIAGTMGSDLDLIAAYTKRYRGNAWRYGKFQSEETFYDEREWRYVQTMADGSPMCMSHEDLRNQDVKNANEEMIKAKGTLPVAPDDIQYLIVPDDNHILELHQCLKELYEPDDAILVTTAIMTIDCITEDV